MRKALLAPIAQSPKFSASGDPENVMAEDGCGIAVAKSDEYIFDMLAKPQSSKWVNTTSLWEDNVWDFNSYDLLVLYPQLPIFYGGHMPAKIVKYINALIEYKGDIVFFVHDPIHEGINYLQACYKRIFESKTPLKYDEGFNPTEVIDKQKLFDSIEKTDMKKQNCWFAFPNLSGFVSDCEKEVSFVDGFRKTFSIVRPQEATLYREDGICYVGVKRPERVKKLKELKAEDTVQFLGPISGKGRSVKISDANNWMRGFTHTLVIGDKGHSNLGLNHRLLQGLAAECICLIDKQLDPEYKLILDPLLQQALYFDDADEFHEKYRFTLQHYDNIMALQNKEAERVFSESVNELIARNNG